MHHRKSSLEVSDRRSTHFRRRSSGHSRIVSSSTQEEDEHLLSRIDSDSESGDSENEEDNDNENPQMNENTVLLVSHSHESGPSAILPFAPAFENRSIALHAWDGGHAAESSPIPLTPRPEDPHPYPEALFCSTSTTSAHSAHTATPHSPILSSRLPTPDYTNPKARIPRHSIRSFLPRGLSFASFHIPARSFLSTTSTPSCSRPQSVRARSDQSTSITRSTFSDHSTHSTSSVDTGRASLIQSIGTTDRFTDKWPAPASVRKVNLRGGALNEAMGLELSQVIVAAMEEGSGICLDTDNGVQGWSVFKWVLLLSVSMVFVYGVTGLVCAIMTWFRTWDKADVMRVVDEDVLTIITLTASILVFTALVGLCGVFLNSRPILATYTLLLWPGLVCILSIGYASYRRVTFALDHKLNLEWSQYYTPLGRLLIQNSLHCCGYYNTLHAGTPSSRCYPRAPLPGCKGKLYRFESDNLATIWSAAFALALLHIVNIFVALLCANHLTEPFGGGITPKQYRLTGKDVRADAEKILRDLSAYPDRLPGTAGAPQTRGFRGE
ncbi:hypothetical protein H0H81_009142 [Sphagnurus paluster]|uniref:Tetraspanin n=1 Tax=Sphagnurus paluster TaxID=117069 RepID=A0A9P7FS89_9AGAR|nr:hypothetical protein H0H81_009142 [Sphagnurus paluster]